MCYFVMPEKLPANCVPQESPEYTLFTEAISSVPKRRTIAPREAQWCLFSADQV